MKENIQKLNNLINMISQLELKATQQNTIILYNIYGTINELIENLSKNNILEKKVEIKNEEE